ncbi:hypothetical protein MMC27_007007 [Xylographa pallens]|nr:hypothetical protein [Xylographa pallens]
MGLATSREVQKYLAKACEEGHGRLKIDDLLFSNIQFVECLEAGWKELSDISRMQLQQKLLPIPKAKNKDIHRVWRSEKSEAFITINTSVENLMPLWNVQPSTFFLFNTSQHHHLSFAEIYKSLNSFDLRQTVDCVRRRFFLLALYQLRQDVQKSGHDFREHLSVLGSDIGDETHKNCQTWAVYGGRYSVLTEKLGGKGILFLLPDDISQNTWERQLPKNGPAHHAMIALLKRRGIGREAKRIDAHKTADAIWTYLETIIKPWSHHEPNSRPLQLRRPSLLSADNSLTLHGTAQPSGIERIATQQQGTSKRRRLGQDVCVSLQSDSVDASMNTAQPGSQNINARMEGLLTAVDIHTNQISPEIERSTENHNFQVVSVGPQSNINFNGNSNHPAPTLATNFAHTATNFEPEYYGSSLDIEPEYHYSTLDIEPEYNNPTLSLELDFDIEPEYNYSTLSLELDYNPSNITGFGRETWDIAPAAFMATG